MTEDEMVGWHHRLDGHEFGQSLGALSIGDGQGGLACCRPWGHSESDTTERLNKSCTVFAMSLLCEEAVLCHVLSRVPLFVTPWTAARQASLSFTISRSLLKLMSIELIMSSNHLSQSFQSR